MVKSGFGAVQRFLERIESASRPELVILHVFTFENAPPFADHDTWTNEWMQEFRDRYVPDGELRSELIMRGGAIEEVVPDVAAEIDATLVAVSWAQDLAPGRARLVKRLLRHVRYPTLLLPLHELGSAMRGDAAADHTKTDAAF